MYDLKDNRVTQDNVLVSASYRMGLNEKRLLIACISKLDPESKAWKAGRAEAEMIATEWGELYGIGPKSAYREMREAAKGLFERSVRIYGDSKKGKEIRWLSAWEWSQNEGRVVLTFSGPVLYYLTGMLDQFTSYDLLGVSGLKSIHSIRLYELASQFKGTGWRHIELDELRKMLSLGDAYQTWDNLKRKVIDRATKEITAKSDLDVSYEIVKRGRPVVAIKLHVSEKQQLELL